MLVLQKSAQPDWHIYAGPTYEGVFFGESVV